MRILLSAYACEPNKGSEAAVGWNFALSLARHCDVWVLTRRNNREPIERALVEIDPRIRPRFIYYDPPRWLVWWKRGSRGMRLYYTIWQIGAAFLARRTHRSVGFDLVHHVTFAMYWLPSFMWLVPVPFVWGPVGGADRTPMGFYRTLGFSGACYEFVRQAVVRLAEYNPFLRITARRASMAFASTPETARRLSALACPDVREFSQVGLLPTEIDQLSHGNLTAIAPLRVIGIGRLLALKGFHLALAALADPTLRDRQWEYWVVGDGPERDRLERLARELRIAEKVRFFGRVSLRQVYELLGQAHVLLHPSMHESGGMVCLEAMAAGRPVICLDAGGPSLLVHQSCGVKIPLLDPGRTIEALAAAISSFISNPALAERMGRAGRRRAAKHYNWDCKIIALLEIYRANIRNRELDAQHV
jgi:glycosyltransferase involved in cell wall biosynthesis